MGTGWWIALGVWGVYALLMILLVRSLTTSTLKYLKAPSPNFMTKCKAAARYDVVHLNSTELYLSALFLLPIRLAGALSLILVTTVLVFIIKTIFCGRQA